MEACNFTKKKAPTQALSCEFCENFKNFYFEKHWQTTASIKFFDKFDETSTYPDDEDRELLNKGDD